MLSASPLGRRRHTSFGNISSTAITSDAVLVSPHNGLVWGVPLDKLVIQNKSKHHVPFIVEKIIEYVEEHGMLGCYHSSSSDVMVLLLGLCQEGLYRVNGNARVIEKLKASFNKS